MATKFNYSVSEFNEVVTNGRNELKDTFSNPFVIINALNKAAKGDFSKMKNCEGITFENVKAVANVVKTLHDNRYAFDACLLRKDSKGRFCRVSKSKTMPIWGYDIIDVNKKGFSYLKPIALNEIAFYNAFIAIAKAEISKEEKARKKAEKEAEKAAKATLSKAQRKAKSANEKAYKELCAKFYKGEICAEEFATKANALKKAA
jgi:regulator of protease activity HflC (stomatin/prohibitin superfamily)